MFKKVFFLGLVLVFSACTTKQVLVCEKEMYLDPFPDINGTVITTGEFHNDRIVKYTNKYVLKITDGEVEEVYRSIKDFYSKEENKILGAEQNFSYGSDYVYYEVVYNMVNYDDSILEHFGNKEDLRFNLEERDSYRCR